MTRCPDGKTGDCFLEFEDNKVYCKFKDIPQPKKKELIRKKYFAVLIDSVRGPLDYKFLEKKRWKKR